MRAVRRSPQPRLPLFTGQAISAADYRAMLDCEESEREAQRRLVAELRTPALTHGPVLAFHVPNGWHIPGLDPRNEQHREWCRKAWEILVADGALPGANDLIVGHNGRTLYLELKRAKGGRVSKAQDAFRDQAIAAGLNYRVARGLREARELLQQEGVLR